MDYFLVNMFIYIKKNFLKIYIFKIKCLLILLKLDIKLACDVFNNL